MKRITNKIIIPILSIFLLTNINVQAETGEIEISKQFEQYNQLDNESKKNTIRPSITVMDKDNNIKSAKSSSNYKAKGNTNLPESYSINEQNITVKNQEYTGSCWAFAYTSAMETTYLKKNQRDALLSPLHIDYTTAKIWNRTVGDGGNNEIAESYLASNYGPVRETTFPFTRFYSTTSYSSPYYLQPISTVYPQNYSQQYRVKDITRYPAIYKTIGNNTITYYNDNGIEYTKDEIDAIRNKIKEHIYNSGAITSYMYTNIVYYNNKYSSIYYDNSSNSYYYDGKSKSTCPEYSMYEYCQPNHMITIVGWDDNYQTKANNKGAYKVLNSWGESFGNGGYFYISYDDVIIETGLAQIDSIENKTFEYNNSYEYDPFGSTLSIIPNSTLRSAYAANKFERSNYVTTQSETLKQVGVFLANDSDIDIYVNPNSSSVGSISNMEHLGKYEGLTAGYHVIDVSNYNIKLTGQYYTVAVKYTNQFYANIPLEVNYYSFLGSSYSNDMTNKITSNYGESYISTNGYSWTDVKSYPITVQNSDGSTVTKKLTNGNATIKAFTVDNQITQIVSNGVYKIASGYNNNYVLDIAGGSKNAKANLQLYQSNNTNAQRFIITYKGNGYYEIQNVLSTKQLDVYGGYSTSGTNVWQYNYNGHDSQLWFIEKTSDGYYKFHPKTNPENLSLNMTSTNTNRANINVYTNSNSYNQKFTLVKDYDITGTQIISKGRYTIQSYKDSSKVLDVKGASTANKANVWLYKSNNTVAQKFNIKYRGNGYYSIMNVKSNKALDVKSASTANSANVWQYTYNGSCAQLWIIKYNSDGSYTFINRCSRKALDLKGAKTANKTNVQIYTSNNSAAQKFRIKAS